MQVFCRKSGGRDPLGDVVFVHIISNEFGEEMALLHTWGAVDRWNQATRGKKDRQVSTLHCGDTLLDVKTGKLRSLTGKIKGNLERQPALDLPSKAEPRLL